MCPCSLTHDRIIHLIFNSSSDQQAFPSRSPLSQRRGTERTEWRREERAADREEETDEADQAVRERHS